MDLNDLIRLTQVTSGATAGPAAPVPAGGPPPPAPPPPPAAAPTPYSPGNAAPGDIHALSNQVLGQPSAMERIAKSAALVPGLGAVGMLLDLVGTIGRGGQSVYQGVAQRNNLDRLQKDLDARAQAEKEQEKLAAFNSRITSMDQATARYQEQHATLMARLNDPYLPENRRQNILAQVQGTRQAYGKLQAARASLVGGQPLPDLGEPSSSPSPYATEEQATFAKSKQEGAGSLAGNPPPKPEDTFSQFGNITYLDPNTIKEAKLADQAKALATKRGVPIIKDGEQKLAQFDTAQQNLAYTLGLANKFLPDSPADAMKSAQNWLGQFNDADIRGYEAARASAIQLVQTAANQGTGNRITTTELTNMLNSAFPRLPHVDWAGPIPIGFDRGDWKASAANKGEFIQTMLQNAKNAMLGQPGAEDALQKSIAQLRGIASNSGDIPTATKPAAAPAATPLTVPGVTVTGTPTDVPGVKKRTAVSAHTRGARSNGSSN